MADVTKTPENKQKVANPDTIQVAGRVDRKVWEKCEDRAYHDGRIKSNAKIVAAALEAYAAGA